MNRNLDIHQKFVKKSPRKLKSQRVEETSPIGEQQEMHWRDYQVTTLSPKNEKEKSPSSDRVPSPRVDRGTSSWELRKSPRDQVDSVKYLRTNQRGSNIEPKESPPSEHEQPSIGGQIYESNIKVPGPPLQPSSQLALPLSPNIFKGVSLFNHLQMAAKSFETIVHEKDQNSKEELGSILKYIIKSLHHSATDFIETDPTVQYLVNDRRVKLIMNKSSDVATTLMQYITAFTDHFSSDLGEVSREGLKKIDVTIDDILAIQPARLSVKEEIEELAVDLDIHFCECRDYAEALSLQGIVIEENHLLCARLYTLSIPPIYKTVNSVLRDALSDDAEKRNQAKNDIRNKKNFINHLQKAISLIPGLPEETVVYRGQSFIPPNIRDYKPGYEIIWPAFSSCSPNKEICAKFASGKLLYYFKLPYGLGANIQFISCYPTEQEILLPMFTMFTVLSVKKTPNIEWVIELSCPEFQPLVLK